MEAKRKTQFRGGASLDGQGSSSGELGHDGRPSAPYNMAGQVGGSGSVYREGMDDGHAKPTS